jgi:flagellar biosynthesis protein FlhB
VPGQDQKTEKPTQQRLQKARREGRFPSSRDFISALQFITVLVCALKFSGDSATEFLKLTQQLFTKAVSLPDLTAAELHTMFRAIVMPFFLHALFIGFGVMALVALVQMASTGFGFSTKQLMPDIKRLNPMSKLQQLPKENLHSVFRSIILLVLVSWFLYSIIKAQIYDISNLALQNLFAGLTRAGSLITELLKDVAAVLFVFGVIDIFRQRSKFNKSMRMSKQEIRDEMKDTEGNTQMKMQIRRLQRDAIRRNMIKAVEKSTVVITNPTHYAIAVQYEMGSRSVPTVVAKGKNYLAKIIRERAKAHEIPIVENKPLAQALYQAVDIGDEIPPALYRAVAEVLAQIYRVINRQ